MISKKEVKKVATLSYLEIKEEEIEKYTQELSKIMDFFNILQKVDTQEVRPLLGSSDLEDITRADNSGISAENKELIKGAPRKQDSYIKTKAVLK